MEVDPVWEAVVGLLLGAPGLTERRSRYGDKPALVLDGREIAHREGPGMVDVRLTRARIRTLPPDPRITRRDSSNWVDLALTGPADVTDPADLLHDVIVANRR